MKPDGTYTVNELLQICNDELQSWEREELADKLITGDMIHSIISAMEPDDIADITGYYCAEDEPEKDIEEFDTSDLIDELESRLNWCSISKREKQQLLRMAENARIFDE